ncbi:MAG: hypothetical protein ABSG53_15400 [Thermoguttaceae bacterium]|jgi:hypothetical protein
MQFSCTINQQGNGAWKVRHASSSLGTFEVSASSRQQALDKMRREIVYRLELCPCTGEMYQHADIELVEATSQ